MRIALTGNPNSGKTTMYNALTGRNEKVGNWAGVTVDKIEHSIKKSYYKGNDTLVELEVLGLEHVLLAHADLLTTHLGGENGSVCHVALHGEDEIAVIGILDPLAVFINEVVALFHSSHVGVVQHAACHDLRGHMLGSRIVQIVADSLIHHLIFQRYGIRTHTGVNALGDLIAEEAHHGNDQHQHADIDDIKTSFLFHTDLLRLTAPSGHCIMNETALCGYIVV